MPSKLTCIFIVWEKDGQKWVGVKAMFNVGGESMKDGTSPQMHIMTSKEPLYLWSCIQFTFFLSHSMPCSHHQ